MIVFYSQSIDNTWATLKDDEHLHCAKVLRKRVSDRCYITDGKGALYNGEIEEISKRETLVKIGDAIQFDPVGHVRGIAIAPTKNIDRFEWFLEKATEIGITDIYPFISKNSERKIIKPLRLQKILVSAMKQSKNFHIPRLHELVKYDRLISANYEGLNKYIAHCMEPESALQKLYKSGDDALVLIGPEGDFTESEVKSAKTNNWQEVSLGRSRLRTETAGLVACHLLNL